MLWAHGQCGHFAWSINQWSIPWDKKWKHNVLEVESIPNIPKHVKCLTPKAAGGHATGLAPRLGVATCMQSFWENISFWNNGFEQMYTCMNRTKKYINTCIYKYTYKKRVRVWSMKPWDLRFCLSHAPHLRISKPCQVEGCDQPWMCWWSAQGAPKKMKIIMTHLHSLICIRIDVYVSIHA